MINMKMALEQIRSHFFVVGSFFFWKYALRFDKNAYICIRKFSTACQKASVAPVVQWIE